MTEKRTYSSAESAIALPKVDFRPHFEMRDGSLVVRDSDHPEWELELSPPELDQVRGLLIPTDAQPTRESVIEECAQRVERGVLEWDEGEFANTCRRNAKEIRALASQPSPAATVNLSARRYPKPNGCDPCNYPECKCWESQAHNGLSAGNESADRLRDAVQLLIDYVGDGCPEGTYSYCMSEAKAAIKGISVVSTKPQPTREKFIAELRSTPSRDENGYICTKDDAIKAFDRATEPQHAQVRETER